MARYIKDVDINQPIDVVSIVIEDFIYHNQFKRSDWNGEMVYSGKDNHGKIRFFKYSYVNSILHVEAWMKGAFGGEKSIATGGGSQAEYRESIERLFNRLQVHSGNIQIGDYVGHDPMNHRSMQSPQPAQPVKPAYKAPVSVSTPPVSKQQTTYTTPKSVYIDNSTPNSQQGGNALLLSVIALFFGFLIPLFGLIMGIIAKKRLQQENVDARQAKMVKTLSTVAIILGILSFAISFILPLIFAAIPFLNLY